LAGVTAFKNNLVTASSTPTALMHWQVGPP